MSTEPTVCFIESLGFLEEQTHKEGEIISRTLQLSGKSSAYAYIRTEEELRAVAKEFGESDHRYLHLSSHGTVNAKGRATGFHLTTGPIASDDMAEILAPHVENRRVFLSSCLAARSTFAQSLLSQSKCLSVLAPMNSIKFDDAAVFWTAFYHLMFKGGKRSMAVRRIKKNVGICASLVQERFRLYYRCDDDTIEKVTIGPLTKPDAA